MEYSAFICHASEDKIEFVDSLAKCLKNFGLNIWYDDFEISYGDNIRRKIDYGLSNSQYGIIILSESFFKKEFANYELDGLLNRKIEKRNILIPIWKDVNKKYLLDIAPSLVDIKAFQYPKMSISLIAENISQIIIDSDFISKLLKLDDEAKAQLLFVEDWIKEKYDVWEGYHFFEINYIDSRGKAKTYIHDFINNDHLAFLSNVRFYSFLGDKNSYVKREYLDSLSRLAKKEREKIFGSIRVTFANSHTSAK